MTASLRLLQELTGANKLVGSGADGVFGALSLGAGFSVSGGVINFAGGGGGGSVTVSGPNKLLGRISAGSGAAEEIDCTAYARSILDDADAAAATTTLGLGATSNVTHERLTIATTTANAIGATFSGVSLTGANTQAVIDVAATWNTTGQANAIKINITDTASGGSSKFIDCQVGGTTLAYVKKNGEIYAQSTVIAGGSTTLIGGSTFGVWLSGTRSLSFNSDCNLDRFAANSLALRNSTSAQAFSVFNSSTSSTNYERLVIDWISSANLARIMTEKGSGGGTARALALGTDGVDRLVIGAAGGVTVDTLYLTNTGAYLKSVASSQLDLYAGNSAALRIEGGYAHTRNGFGISGGSPAASSDVTLRRSGVETLCFQNATTGGIAIEGIELAADPAAPAANKGVTYYRDNGSGKTQYCVRFATGAVQVLATEP